MSLTNEELKWATVMALTTVNTVKTVLAPDRIRIVKPPNKLEYIDGDSIDYTGIVVAIYAGNYRWETKDYPQGIIPFNELVFPIDTVHLDIPPEERIYSDPNGTINALMLQIGEASGLWKDIAVIGGNKWRGTGASGNSFYITRYGNELYSATVDLPEWSTNLSVSPVGGSGITMLSRRMTKNFTRLFYGDQAYVCSGIPVSLSDPNGLATDELVPPIFTINIPVQWRTFSDSFGVQVSAD